MSYKNIFLHVSNRTKVNLKIIVCNDIRDKGRVFITKDLQFGVYSATQSRMILLFLSITIAGNIHEKYFYKRN